MKVSTIFLILAAVNLVAMLLLKHDVFVDFMIGAIILAEIHNGREEEYRRRIEATHSSSSTEEPQK